MSEFYACCVWHTHFVCGHQFEPLKWVIVNNSFQAAIHISFFLPQGLKNKKSKLTKKAASKRDSAYCNVVNTLTCSLSSCEITGKRVRNLAPGRPKLGSESFTVGNVYLASKRRMGSSSEAGRAGRLSNASHLCAVLWPPPYNLMVVLLKSPFWRLVQ